MENIKSAQKIVNFTLMGVLTLALAKIILGLYFSSNAIVADGIHSLGDALIVALIIVALKFISKKPSERFPYGYYKVEDLIVLLLSVMFFFLAVDIIFEAIPAIISWSVERKSIYASLVAFLSGVFSLGLSKLQERAAKLTNIQSILMNAEEMKYDSIASIIVGFALFTGNYINVPMDSLAALVLSIFIIKISLEGAKDAILDLLDAWGKPALIEHIRDRLERERYILKVVNVRLRKAGPLILGDATIHVPETLDLSEIRDLEKRVLNDLRKIGIHDFILHIVPVEEEQLRVAIPMIDNRICEHFGRAPKLAVYEINKRNRTYRLIEVVDNPFIQQKELVGINLVKLLSKYNIGAVITLNIGENAFYMLRGHKIKIFRTTTSDIDTTIKLLIDSKLIELTEPTKKQAKNNEY